jgi:transcriptional regulator with XRE-family HTH domain
MSTALALRIPTTRPFASTTRPPLAPPRILPSSGFSRVENGHTVPAIETLEKLARALEIPMYQLFYDGDEPVKAPAVFKRESSDDGLWGNSGKDAKFLNQLRRLLGKAKEDDRKLILYTLQKMAR